MIKNFFKFMVWLLFPERTAVYVSERQGFSNGFRLIAEQYGLWNHVEIRRDWLPPQHRIRLFRIIEREEDRELPLPPDFVNEIREMTLYYYGERTLSILGVPLEFLVVPGMTIDEIKKAQREWRNYCENFHAGD